MPLAGAEVRIGVIARGEGGTPFRSNARHVAYTRFWTLDSDLGPQKGVRFYPYFGGL
jgi:hypothetical protein